MISWILLLRMYSHMREMFEHEQWCPEGMPAVYRLLERLSARQRQVDVYLEDEEAKGPLGHKVFPELPGIRFHRFSSVDRRGNRWGIFKNVLQQRRSVLSSWQSNANVLWYVDRAHFLCGGWLARCGYPVVLRLHGLAGLPVMVERLQKSFFPSLRLWLLRSPFRAVIGTEDGSPYSSFISRFLHPEVPIEIRLNGVDMPQTPDARMRYRHAWNLDRSHIVVGAVGRLDPDKSPEVLWDAFREAYRENPYLRLVYVGEGSLRASLEERAEKEGLQPIVIFTGRVPHTQVLDILQALDIYVSLNLFGNLSNCTLEAIRAGRCIVTMAPDPASGRDDFFRRSGLSEVVHLIDRSHLREALTQKLLELAQDPRRITESASRVLEWGEKHLLSWDARCDWEIDFVEAHCG